MNIVVLKQLYKDSCIPEMQNSRNRLSGKQWCISLQHIINPSCNPCIFILILTEYWHALKQQKVLTQWETCDDLNVLSLWSPQFYPELHEAQTFFFFLTNTGPRCQAVEDMYLYIWFLSGFDKPLAASERPLGLLHGENSQLAGTLGSHNLGGHCTERKMARFVQLLMSWISD